MNNEKFNAMLNNCQRPRAVYNALAALSGDSTSEDTMRTDTPNFLRLAQELNKFKDPYKAADLLLSVAGATLREGATE